MRKAHTQTVSQTVKITIENKRVSFFIYKQVSLRFVSSVISTVRNRIFGSSFLRQFRTPLADKFVKNDFTSNETIICY